MKGRHPIVKVKKAEKFLLVTLSGICLLPVAAISFTIGWRRLIGPWARATRVGGKRFRPGGT
jgi:hypothetical protein